MAYKKKTWYNAGQEYFDTLDEARKYALKIGTFKIGISRNGVHIGDVDCFRKEWITYSGKPRVGHNGTRYVVYLSENKRYRLNPDGSTNGEIKSRR